MPSSVLKSQTATPPPRDHVAIASQYIADVLGGKIPACEYVKQACRRQRDDLKRFADHPIYRWDEKVAGRACRFIERLPHVKGPKARVHELIILEPWQCFIITTVFGWLRKDTGGRRFKRTYVEVPRGNGKSAISSGIALYGLAADGEPGAEVYSAATTREQAKVVWSVAKMMLEQRKDFANTIGVSVGTHSIYHQKSGSLFVPLSREAKNQDGANVHLAVVDELHAHQTRDTYDVIETGCGKRNSSLLWVITTAGSDMTGICYEVRGYVLKVLSGVLEDDAQFGVVYTIDEGDDWQDPKVWVKANPNLGVSVMPEGVVSLALKAKSTPAAQASFKTKHLDIWVNADSPAFSLEAWDRCADPSLNLSDFVGQPCVLGVDLASKIDIAAKVKIFARTHPKTDEKEAEVHYYLFADNYLPEDAVRESSNASYVGWELEKWLLTTPGDVLDFETVKQAIKDDVLKYDVLEVAYDPYQALQMAQELMAESVKMVEVRPTVLNFSAPMKELNALMRQGRIHHNGNPVMRWMVSNVVGHYDVKDNIYPRKERPEHKIDGVIASIMAMNRAMNRPPPPPLPRVRAMRSKG